MNRTLFRYLSAALILFMIFLVISADMGTCARWFGRFYLYPGGDKVGHFLMMGTLSLLVNLAMGGRLTRIKGLSIPSGILWVWPPVFLEECSQYFFSLRNCSVLDLMADTAGIVLGGLLAVWLSRRIFVQEPTS